MHAGCGSPEADGYAAVRTLPPDRMCAIELAKLGFSATINTVGAIEMCGVKH
jgi:hypothetical protein